MSHQHNEYQEKKKKYKSKFGQAPYLFVLIENVEC